MEVGIEPIIRKDKINKEGKVPVCLRFTRKGKRLYHSLKIRIPVDKWIEGHYVDSDGKSEWVEGRIASSYPNADILNNKIAKEKGRMEREMLNLDLQGSVVSLTTVDKLLKVDSGSRGDFHQYAHDVVFAELKKLVDREGYSTNTYRLKDVQYRKLKKLYPNLIFADITPVFLTKLYKYLTIEQKNPISHNSSTEMFKYIRQVFTHANSAGITTFYPFKEWKDFPVYEETDPTYLTFEECQKIEALLHEDIPEEVKKVAAFFLLECYSGIRVGDWNNYELEKLVRDNTMMLTTNKTDKRVTLPLDLMPSLTRLLAFVKGNNLVFAATEQHANRTLKTIATAAKIKKHLTTHVGRHSFATQNLSIGVSKEAIASALGVSMRVVNIYARIIPEKMKNELTRIGGGI